MASFYVICFAASPSGQTWYHEQQGWLYLTRSEGRLYLTQSEGRLYLTRTEKATDGRVSARPHCALGCSVVFLHQILWAEWGRGREGGRRGKGGEERGGRRGEGTVSWNPSSTARHGTAQHTHTRTCTHTHTHTHTYTHTYTQHLTLSYWHNPSLMTSASSLVTLGRLVKLPVRSPDGCFLK